MPFPASSCQLKLEMLREEQASVKAKAELERMHALHGETSQRVKVSEEELKKARADCEDAAKQLAEDQAAQTAALGMTLEQYIERLAAKEAPPWLLAAKQVEAQRVKSEEAEAKFWDNAEMASRELGKLKKDLAGKRKVHEEPCQGPGNKARLGFTYKKLSSVLFQVSKIKPGGFADKSGLIQPIHVLHYVDGVGCNACAKHGLDLMTELLQGRVSCRLRAPPVAPQRPGPARLGRQVHEPGGS